MATNIAIFASGGGSNAESIIQHFADRESADIALIVSNKPNAYVLQRAENHSIDHETVSRKDYKDAKTMLSLLALHDIDFIVLAGFLWLIPSFLTEAFPKKIVNIHPALLPQYGGKGMYGKHVHQAVFDNNERQSGITIHYVNENYDEGQIIFQETVDLLTTDTPDVIASKVLALEHEHFAKTIESIL